MADYSTVALSGSDPLTTSFLAMGVAFVLFALIIGLAAYIYCALALMKIAKRTKTDKAWLAWIPIANLYLLIKIGGLQWWLIFGLLLVMIPNIGGLLVTVLMAYIWWNICAKLKRPEWWGILLVIPILNLIMLGILAWGKK